MTANPGSEEAVKQGCTCAVIDNHYGRGVPMGDERVFWMNDDCPIHGKSHYFTEIGRRGGKSTSEVKTTASRENGRKGGRPRKRDKDAINNPQ